MNKALEYAKRIAYSSEETLMFTYEMATKYADSPGCYVECGVAAGAQIIAMKAGAPNKVVHAFDSFEGIPFPSNRDDQMPGIRILTEEERRSLPNPGEVILKSTGATSVPVHDFMDHVIMSGVRQHGIMIQKGWFEETLPAWKTEPIAILRLDGDLYNSTAVCLKHLYPLVLRGGVLIIDDWQLKGCRDAVYDYFASIKECVHISIFQIRLQHRLLDKAMRKITNIILGWWYFITNQNNKLAHKRLSICVNCELYKWFVCTECGCPGQTKARIEDEHCGHPDGDKWKDL